MVVRLHADIDGLIETEAAFYTAIGMLPEQVALAGVFSALIVAETARVFAPKGPHEGGGTVVPLWTVIRAEGESVAFGGDPAPHGAVVNFGGHIPRHHSRTRTRVARQEHIYRAIGFEGERIRHQYEDAVFRTIGPLF